ncbi:unnamed protein product [Mytilus coruscus]|uniref:Uncharacterized protein n=1 Tax=Mytilus coruscus TaxID=42192 RepID=A0A6J8D500_MYTCO|nr:unnamed protein product [Mytilus coruscus]
MFRRSARKQKVQDLARPRTTTTRASIVTIGPETQTTMALVVSAAVSPIYTGSMTHHATHSIPLGGYISSGAIYARPQNSASACINTVSSFTQHRVNNIPVLGIHSDLQNQYITLKPTCTSNIQQMQPSSNPRQRPANAFMRQGAYPIRIKYLEACLLFIDSSGNQNLGSGAFFDGIRKWDQLKWPQVWCTSPILRNVALLELIPVILGLYLWADLLRNEKIRFNIDNLALLSIVNKRNSNDKQIVKLIRPLVLLTMLNNVQFINGHINGPENKIADAISSFQMDCFRCFAPTADIYPAPIPLEFLTVISDL